MLTCQVLRWAIWLLPLSLAGRGDWSHHLFCTLSEPQLPDLAREVVNVIHDGSVRTVAELWQPGARNYWGVGGTESAGYGSQVPAKQREKAEGVLREGLPPAMRSQRLR